MFNGSEPIEVKRDCEATLIPSGSKVSIKEGSLVMVTQALGNSYTLYLNGNLVRIAGKDGDAIGLVILEDSDINEMFGSVEEKIDTQLRTCFDPEIPVNIVDLGLIYDKQILPLGRDEYQVSIIMTLTAAGCGMGPVLVADIHEKLRAITGVMDVKVDLVFDPPWERSMMSEAAQLQLGMM